MAGVDAAKSRVAAQPPRSDTLAHVWIVAGDIGGTKTELAALERTPAGAFRQRAVVRYASSEFASLDAIAGAFMATVAQRCGDLSSAELAGAAFGVAGPVIGRTSRITNLPWHIDADALQTLLAAPCELLNDFAAVALGVGLLSSAEQCVLQAGEVDPTGPVAVLGAGTGLGEAVLVPATGGPRVLASEGGHTDFAPRNPTEARLLAFLWQRHERVSVERVVSGLGLPAIFDFVCEDGLATPRTDTLAAMEDRDRSAVIGERGQDGSDPACARALQMFVELYGAEAGNLALKVIPTGGLYVAGGIAPRVLPLLQDGRFMGALLDKGRMHDLLSSVRVAVVLEPRVGLFGAARMAALCGGVDNFTRAHSA